MMYWPWNALIVISIVTVFNGLVMYAGWKMGRAADARAETIREQQFADRVERYVREQTDA